MSQRSNNFKGGIQKGTTAFDEESHKLDGDARMCRDKLAELFPSLTMSKKMDNVDKIKTFDFKGFGFSPDGGFWSKDGQIVAAFECKKQGRIGNAIERWYKNASIAKHINPNIKYVTFMTGEGAAKGECLDNHATMAKMLMGDNFTFFCKAEGFTLQEMEDIMSDVLKTVE